MLSSLCLNEVKAYLASSPRIVQIFAVTKIVLVYQTAENPIKFANFIDLQLV